MNDSDSLLHRYLGIAPQSESENTIRLLVRMGLLVAGGDEGSLLVLDDASQTLIFAMTIGDAESASALLGQRVPLGQGITGLAAATQEVQIGAPTYKDVQQSVRADGLTGGPTAVMAAPIMIEERLIGVLTAVSFAAAKHFTTDEAKLFGGFAAISGVVIGQAQRLAAFSASTNPAQGPRARIDSSIAHLAEVHPGALEEIAAQLEGIERLVAAR
jgi:GAF domain-containing protein